MNYIFAICGVLAGFSPLWGYYQEYKIEKNAILQERLYQKNEALLLITTLPCLKVFASLIMKNKSKSSWHTVSLTRMEEEEVYFWPEPSLAVIMEQSVVPVWSVAVVIGDVGTSFAVRVVWWK